MPNNIEPFLNQRRPIYNCKSLKSLIFDHYLSKTEPPQINENKPNYTLNLSQVQIKNLDIFVSK